MNSWEKFPQFPHLSGVMRERMEKRRRHKQVRYLIFCLQTANGKSEDLAGSGEYPPGFIEFWLAETPKYAISPKGERVQLPVHLKGKRVFELGGYKEFAKKWDVDDELFVFIRHSSIWQEWNTKLAMMVPSIQEE